MLRRTSLAIRNPTGHPNQSLLVENVIEFGFPDVSISAKLENHVMESDLILFLVPVEEKRSDPVPITVFTIGVTPKTENVSFNPMEAILSANGGRDIQPYGFSTGLGWRGLVINPDLGVITSPQKISLREGTTFHIYFTTQYIPENEYLLALHGLRAGETLVKVPMIRFTKHVDVRSESIP